MGRMSANDRLLEAGYEGVTILENFGYDSALIGVTTNNEAVYSFEAMVECLMNEEGFSQDEAVEWIEYNTIRALPYMTWGPAGRLYSTTFAMNKRKRLGLFPASFDVFTY